MIFEPFQNIATIDAAALTDVCKDKSLKECITETAAPTYTPVTATNYAKSSYAITKLITLVQAQKATNADLENQIQTFEESVKQQEQPETTLTVKAQTTGPLAIPRPLKPIGIALLFGLAFIFFFTSVAFLAKSLPTGSGSSWLSMLSFDTVKNIAIGILAVAILFMGLALGKVI